MREGFFCPSISYCWTFTQLSRPHRCLSPLAKLSGLRAGSLVSLAPYVTCSTLQDGRARRLLAAEKETQAHHHQQAQAQELNGEQNVWTKQTYLRRHLRKNSKQLFYLSVLLLCWPFDLNVVTPSAEWWECWGLGHGTWVSPGLQGSYMNADSKLRIQSRDWMMHIYSSRPKLTLSRLPYSFYIHICLFICVQTCMFLENMYITPSVSLSTCYPYMHTCMWNMHIYIHIKRGRKNTHIDTAYISM